MKNALFVLGIFLWFGYELLAIHSPILEDQAIGSSSPVVSALTFPDRDNDGIEDSKDACPDTYGLAQFNGCPDTDGDGIMDSEDECPTLKGSKGHTGCPETNNKVNGVLHEALKQIQFESGQAMLKSSSHDILQKVHQVMMEYPQYHLKIVGHSDGAGDAEMNRQLSEHRASAVKAFLIKTGVESDRLEIMGLGESVPVADNETVEGRAKNRRVELTVKIK